VNGFFLGLGKNLEPVPPGLDHPGLFQIDNRSIYEIRRPAARRKLRSESLKANGAGHHRLFDLYERVGLLESAEYPLGFTGPPSLDDINDTVFLGCVDQRLLLSRKRRLSRMNLSS
jgi:hypothetical protein